MAQQRLLTVLHYLLLNVCFIDALFHHRQRSSSIVVNGVLYIDNGEIVSWNGSGSGLISNGSAQGDFIFQADNNTYSIDLAQPWTNTSVTINSLPKTAPVEVSGALWAGADDKTFYAYDGGRSLGIFDLIGPSQPILSVTPNQLWQFTPSGLKGTWSQVAISGNGSALVRLQEPTYASGGGLGFALGGLIQAGVDQGAAVSGNIQAPHGMIVYNMTDNTWQNVSAGYDYARGSLVGAGLYVQQFGPQGVFLVFGGITDQQTQIALDNVFIYEPLSQQWAIQSVTGDTPPGSNNPCVVGLQGDNGTYEIFLYGGEQPRSNDYRICDGSVYVLSLPAFHWQRISATVKGRYRHTCNIAGNRQMISVGGIVFPGPLNNASDWLIGGPDPWPNGLGVFDLTDLAWKSSYQPDAKPYVTADRVKAYYQSNGRYPASWTSDNVNQWFVKDSTVNLTSNSTTSGAPSSSSMAAAASSNSSSNLGAIIGGAVGGGVGLIIVIVGAFCIIRRHRYKKVKQADSADTRFGDREATPGELHAESKPHELAETNAYQLHKDSERNEIFGKTLHELHPDSRPYEVDGGTRYELPGH